MLFFTKKKSKKRYDIFPRANELNTWAGKGGGNPYFLFRILIIGNNSRHLEYMGEGGFFRLVLLIENAT